jgi:uncharacterized lipoprotein YajG
MSLSDPTTARRIQFALVFAVIVIAVILLAGCSTPQPMHPEYCPKIKWGCDDPPTPMRELS